MSRSLKKGPFVEARLLGRIDEMKSKNERKVLKTWSRASVIFPQMIGHTIAVHDGRRHVPVFITENMVAPLRRRGPARPVLPPRERGPPPPGRIPPAPPLPRSRQGHRAQLGVEVGE